MADIWDYDEPDELSPITTTEQLRRDLPDEFIDARGDIEDVLCSWELDPNIDDEGLMTVDLGHSRIAQAVVARVFALGIRHLLEEFARQFDPKRTCHCGFMALRGKRWCAYCEAFPARRSVRYRSR
jgi:hypothetical protein